MFKRAYNSIVGERVIYTDKVRVAYSSASICGGGLRGKSVLITGAYGGIGTALAYRFLIEGAIVFLAGRNTEKLRALYDKLVQLFDETNIHCITIDCLDLDVMLNAIGEELKEQKIDILINNSGIFTEVDKKRTFKCVSKEQFELVWKTNYLATYELSKKLAEKMNNNGGGHIINISSICAETSRYMYTPYGISKRAVLGIKKEIESVFENVVVHSILPGTVATNMNNAKFGDDIMLSRNHLGRAILPEEIAAIVAWISTLKDNLKSESITASAFEVL